MRLVFFRNLMGQILGRLSTMMQQAGVSIPLWEYGKEGQGWTQRQPGKDQQENQWEEFRVVTYNIWFSDQYQPMRFNSLCEILKKSDAHIIALQESSFSVS